MEAIPNHIGRKTFASKKTKWHYKVRQLFVASAVFCFTSTVLAADADDFVITVKTDNSGTSSSTQFTIPTTGGGYLYNVDCDNDGSNEAVWQTGDYTCDYGVGNEGTYTIRIKDDSGAGTGFPRIFFAFGGDRFKLRTVEQWGTGHWTSMEEAFDGTPMTLNATDVPDLSGVINMREMFRYTNVNSDLSGWDVSTVENMDTLFGSTDLFNQDLSSWNVGNVTDMGGMFAQASAFNQNLNSWNVENVEEMDQMFSSATLYNQPMDNWDVSTVWDMHHMFNNAPAFNQDISGWTTTSLTSMGSMFSDATVFNQHIGGWNVSGVTDMSSLFSSAVAFNQDISGWSVALVDDMEGMFYRSPVFNQDISGWDVGLVENMSEMFYEATVFNQDIGGWNVSSVEDMEAMFYGATVFDQDLSGWDVSVVEYMDDMFEGISLSTINYDALLNGWNILGLHAGVTFDGGNSSYCTAGSARESIDTAHSWTIHDGGYDINCPNDFVITVQTDDPSGASGIAEFIIPTTGGGYNYNVDCDNDGSDEATGQTGNYTCDYGVGNEGTYTIRIKDNSGAGMGFPRIFFAFGGDRFKLRTVEQWGTGHWTSMEEAFDGADNLVLNATDVPDLSGVMSMREMLRYTNVNSDLSGWDVSNVENMDTLFGNARFFNQDLSSWNVGNVTDMGGMFAGALVFNQNLNSWNVENVEEMDQMFTTALAYNQPMDNWDVSTVWDMHHMFNDARAFNQDISGWTTTSLTSMGSMFSSAIIFNQDLNGWDVSLVDDMAYLFSTATAFNQDLSSWDVGSVEDMNGMFYRATVFNQDISGWTVGLVEDMSEMFYEATAFNQDIGSWDVSSVTDMEEMFEGATAFNQDIGGWDVSLVEYMDDMFEGVKLSTINYDALLNGWDALSAYSGVTFSGGNSNYCMGDTARANMISTDSWTIDDGGVNCYPTITSDGGGDTATIMASENQQSVTTVIAETPTEISLNYSISGGVDQSKFTIDAISGVLTFIVAPDYEAPSDADTNNTYILNVSANAGEGLDTQIITVTVSDLSEATSSGGGAPSRHVVYMCNQANGCINIFPAGSDQAYKDYKTCYSDSQMTGLQCARIWALAKGYVAPADFVTGAAVVVPNVVASLPKEESVVKAAILPAEKENSTCSERKFERYPERRGQGISNENLFTDVDTSHFAYRALIDLAEQGIVSGDADTGNARLDGKLKRAEFVKLLTIARGDIIKTGSCAGSVSFSDVIFGSWYYDFVLNMKVKKIVSGYAKNLFKPGNNINIAEAYKVMAISFGYLTEKEAEELAAEFNLSWYVPYKEALSEIGVIPASLDAKEISADITRGDAFVLLYNILNVVDAE